MSPSASKPARIAEFVVFHTGHSATKYALDITKLFWTEPTVLRTWTWADRPTNGYESQVAESGRRPSGAAS